MSNLLVRLFIKDYQNTQDARVRERYGKLSGIVGIITNLLLFVIKVSVGLFLAVLRLWRMPLITFQILLPLW